MFAAAAVLIAIVEGVVRYKAAGTLLTVEPDRLDKLRTAAFSHTATDGQMLRYMATVLRELEADPTASTKRSPVFEDEPHSYNARQSAAPNVQVRKATLLHKICDETPV